MTLSASVFDQRAFRTALGNFVTGVTIVTSCDVAGRPVGLTANSFNSVSLDPPLILWSLALDSPHLDAFRVAPWWAVHILASDQEDLSARFAQRGIDKFADLAVVPGPGGIPLLDNVAARFICRTAFEYEGGDHAIFVGEVRDFSQTPRPPLVYHLGRYAQVLPGSTADLAGQGGFSRHFIGHLLGRAHHELCTDVRREYLARGLCADDYTVLMAIGLDTGIAHAALCDIATKSGVGDPSVVIGNLAARGLITGEDGILHASESAARMMVELIAVAQASQMRLEERLSPAEVTALRVVLERIAGEREND